MIGEGNSMFKWIKDWLNEPFWGPIPKPEPRLIDVSPRTWGCFHDFIRGDLAGNADIWIFTSANPRKGDHLLLKSINSPDGKARYLIRHIEPAGNPHDMYMCTVT